ncbi:septum site-determining protein MinC [Candidatus Palibaumannia cicadellinicola]|uniref:Probable septum site-determining protein MinC n=1 Tax=Baumannia cicadellinicola subsp. Homalodisca coagulata TaxID=374463 RepID=MINC_BAUCH|nr:septum site-determining protein MinC [Candidatus Baumannia cicadellinicola]Q1LT29.1 RecName: Full=Probable septum site-determining protein MinC [Baumannia cicadellinicola str. Hc (Homalodisca coagulata)]ABF13952.1 septum site-determining protein MinC [Baumannia cicadellinicola str. Hc (Homalodisca coagulata)]MBS0032793.1 septum site-determining protein MinC [Candidatus Baumannia cicadellinicola]MBS0032862.1 septum site-determining protein MinC [Candidatus Baumannia cicadellinicola]MCJ746207
MIHAPIDFKGSNFTLLVIHIYDAPIEVIIQAIQDKITQAPQLLKNAPVILNVASLSPECNWINLLKAILSTGLHVVAVSGCNNSTLKNDIIISGLPLITEGQTLQCSSYTTTPIKSTLSINNKTKLIHTPIRSGQQIYAKNSDLVITNNVSAGAELIADGNIHIYGMMRGRALAGASGDSHCQIFCSYLFPELVSIAGQYWIDDQIPAELLGKAGRIYLHCDALSIQPLIF